MKRILSTIAIFSCIFLSGCSDTSSPAGNPNVKIIGELATPYVTMSLTGNKDRIMVDEVDSIKIIRIRILMSEMSLFLQDDNSISGQQIKTGPFVYDLSLTGGLAVLGENEVPPGNYEKLKIKFHRFSSSEAGQFHNDLVFGDFATPERYSILIEGITYQDDNPSTFIFKSQTTANLFLPFEPNINLKSGATTTISIQIDPNYFFKKWGAIIDPSDPENINDIENTIKNTIKALKK